MSSEKQPLWERQIEELLNRAEPDVKDGQGEVNPRKINFQEEARNLISSILPPASLKDYEVEGGRYALHLTLEEENEVSQCIGHLSRYGLIKSSWSEVSEDGRKSFGVTVLLEGKEEKVEIRESKAGPDLLIASEEVFRAWLPNKLPPKM